MNPTTFDLPRSIAELEFEDCPRLTSLQDCLQPDLLPNLKSLHTDNCEGLKSLPIESFDRFLTLERLKISLCRMLTCPVKMVLPPSAKELTLQTCGKLEHTIPSCSQNLTSLTLLKISDCQHLVSIPEEVMGQLKSLQSLHVKYCRAIRSLGEAQFPASLKHHEVQSCRRLQLTGGENYNGIPFSAPAIETAAPSSSHAIPSTPENSSIDIHSTINVKKRKASTSK